MAAHAGLIHLHAGDLAAMAHRRSGLPGELRVCRDSPAVGPWSPDPWRLPRLRALWWGVPPEEFRSQDLLLDLAEAREAVLWFGPDPWEQACLLWVLAELPEGCFPDLVPLDQPASLLPPAAFAPHFATRVLLPEALLQEARSLWDRFLKLGWGGLAGCGIPGLPWLAPALDRLAEDHPPFGAGRTRRQLDQVLRSGAASLPEVMARLQALETTAHGAWYGDHVIARMAEAAGVRLA